ncbi:hypothetical protein B488_12880 [Liberibacter crescens BT-1]|uniref:Flp pilus assembly protein, pilin Flp n=1 Tax=Liberibacter crescens (strain BT-1) TaxID=1215343 RepID=L0EWP2_LIBCB|nr:Flp family type IVb pilin [Liberibacter crescens]AGA65280.1 hypothetical protein B488_12880 [Liberibacter crescens BT-1]
MVDMFIRCKIANCGATAIEYAILAAVISIAVIAAAQSMGVAISNNFNTIAKVVNTANSQNYQSFDSPKKLNTQDQLFKVKP